MNPILQRLLDMDQKNRLHHGFLFVGSSDTATAMMNETVTELSVHLLSKEIPNEKSVVQKKIEGLNHPDFFKLQADDSEIKIEAIREMQKWLFLPPLESSRKIAVIPQAHHLNTSCSNALLKTLEEPPTYALLILQTNSLSRILPTIRSRLFNIQFPEKESAEATEEKEWMGELQTLLSKRTYTDKEMFAFTETFSDKRDDLVFVFDTIHRTVRERMLNANSTEFNRLEKQFDLALGLEQEIYQNYGNISLGLDRFLISWRNT